MYLVWRDGGGGEWVRRYIWHDGGCLSSYTIDQRYLGAYQKKDTF